MSGITVGKFEDGTHQTIFRFIHRRGCKGGRFRCRKMFTNAKTVHCFCTPVPLSYVRQPVLSGDAVCCKCGVVKPLAKGERRYHGKPHVKVVK